MVKESSLEKLKDRIVNTVAEINNNLKEAGLEVAKEKTQFTITHGSSLKEWMKIEELEVQESKNIRILGYYFSRRYVRNKHWIEIFKKLELYLLLLRIQRGMLRKLPGAWKRIVVHAFVISMVIGLPRSTLQDLKSAEIRSLVMRKVAEGIKIVYGFNMRMSNIFSYDLVGLDPPWVLLHELFIKLSKKDNVDDQVGNKAMVKRYLRNQPVNDLKEAFETLEKGYRKDLRTGIEWLINEGKKMIYLCAERDN